MIPQLTKALAGLLVLLSCSQLSAQHYIYVKAGGEGVGKGTKSNPYTSLKYAVKTLPKLTKEMDQDIIVYLQKGRHELDDPIVLDENHSGRNGYKVIFKALEGNPVISGGKQVTQWKSVDGKIFKASLDRSEKLRALFVNGERKRMAGTEVPVNGLGDWGRFEIKGNESWAFGSGSGIAGIKFPTSDVQKFKSPDDIELVQFNIWTEKILCTQAISIDGDTTIFKLQQPYGAIATSMAWAGKINYQKSFVIRNAYELMNQPGEFYFDKHSKTLYYFKEEGENLQTAEVIAPMSEGLVRIQGSSTIARASNIEFQGITFSHDDWGLMEVEGSNGFAGIQSLGLAVKYVPGGNWHPTMYNSTDVPTGAIHVKNAANILLERNRFIGLNSAVAINLVNDVVNTTVNGNFFYNNLGNAVNVGHPQHYKIGDGDLFEAGVEGVCKDVIVSNNYLRSVCLDFRQVEGITAFFVENVRILHNDIQLTPYGAIVLGWWWGNSDIPPSEVAKNNTIAYNKAGDTHQVLDDGGIIYVLGEQPNSFIKNNYVFNGPRSIYPDDGSAYWTIVDNVVGNPSYKHMWLHLWTKRCHDIVAYRNYVKNHFYMDNGTNNIVEQTYSFREDDFSTNPAAQKIIDEAGIEAAYQDIVPDEELEIINIFPKGFKETDRFH